MSTRFATADEAETAFYRAFRELDLELMGQVWSRDPETVCLHPGGGLLQGRAVVMQSWRGIFSNTERPSIRHRTLQVTASGELAVHLVEEQIRPGGAPEDKLTRVLSTNVYRRARDGWRMVAHHASLPLVDKRPREQQPTLLH